MINNTKYNQENSIKKANKGEEKKTIKTNVGIIFME
jgi:hypothetical protein